MESKIELNKQYISSEVRFYTIQELREMLGWSENTIQKMFNDPKFPAADFGKTKVVAYGFLTLAGGIIITFTKEILNMIVG